MHPLLQIQDLQVDFETGRGAITAVQGISLAVNRGEILALVGESGSGKSVTSLSILRLLPAATARYTRGKILFSQTGDGQIDLLQVPGEELQSVRGNKVAMIFQEPMTSLNPVFTCGQQVVEAIRLHQGLSRKAASEKTIGLFGKVKLPDAASLFHRYPHQLSGGQKQRVMIAMAMSCQPALLICDEPTTALDVTVQQTILELIKELQAATQMGVIFITHDLGVVGEIAHRVAVMYKGNIVEQGTVEQVLQQPQHPYTRGLLACRPSIHPKGFRLPVVSDFLNGSTETARVLRSIQPPVVQPQNGSRVLLRAGHLEVKFPAKKNFFGKPLQYVRAVDDLSFDVFQGETLGLVGESGCGKTTLGRALLRLVEPSAGKIIFNGADITQTPESGLRGLRKEMQLVFQDPYSALNPRITIGDAIGEVLQVHNIVPTRGQRKEKVAEMLQKVSLDAAYANRYPHEFSGGQRQRIVIARALSLNPSFIVCDESVSALDVSVQAQILNLLSDLKKEFGFTIIFISHDLSVVHYTSDRIMVMQQGKIVEMGAAEQVYRNPTHPYTRRLIAAIPGGTAGNS